MTENLWGYIPGAASMATPYSILIGQGKLLSDHTGGQITGYVQKTTSSGEFSVDLFLRVEQLNNYRYHLLRVQHSVELYPLYMTPSGKKSSIACFDEEEFKRELKVILSGDSTMKIIQALLAQIRDDVEEIPF
ncbi:hypothetical protein [Janthinobacterium svalbardensis]|uniref:hypothetical protein n=1 Tax=Janthinobacterium svalbardensis TaxID=368607 RepID=UPI002FCDB743